MEKSQTESPIIINIPCQRHPTKRIEYVCVKPNCDQEGVYCTACVFKKCHCRHDDYIRDLEEVISEQQKQFDLNGLLLAPDIYTYCTNKPAHLADYTERIRSQENIIDDEIDTLISDITSSLEDIRKSMHKQLRLYIENFKTMFQSFDTKVAENFNNFYLSKFNSFQEMVDIYKPFTMESLIKMLENLLKDYPDRFKVPTEIKDSYNSVQTLQNDVPQFDLQRFNSIKGYFTVFKDKLIQNITIIVNVEEEENIQIDNHNMSNLYTDKSGFLTQRDVSQSRIFRVSSNRQGASLRKSVDALDRHSERGRSQNVSISGIQTPEVSFISQSRDSTNFKQFNGSRIKAVSKSISDMAFGKNIQTVEIRRIQMSTSFESFHSRTILCLLYLKNSLIASSSDDGMIKIWDIISFRCVKVLKGHTAGIRSISVLENGDLVSGSWDKTIKIWKTAELVNQYDSDGKGIKISELSMTLKGHLNAVLVVFVMPDGRTIISGSTDYQIKLWDSETGQCFKTFTGHNGEVLTLACRADNKTIISGGGDRVIKIWSAEKKTNICVNTMSGHVGPVWSIRLLSDDVTLASSSPDKMIKLWNIEKGICTRTITGHQNHVLNLLEFKDNSLLSCDNEGVIKIWALSTSVCLHTIQNKTGPIHALAVTEDYMIVGGGGDKRIYIWN